MNTILTAAGQGLIEAVIPLLQADGKDYSSNLVVFPGRRPSHFLRKALAVKEGASFIPPRILSMDEFIDVTCEEALGLNTIKLDTLDAVAMLYEIHRTSDARLGGSNFLTADAFFPLGLKLYHDLEELCIEGVPLSRVREIDAVAELPVPRQSLKRLQALSHFYDAFYVTVGERGCSTRSSRYLHVSRKIGETGLATFRRAVFAGFFALTKAEREIFGALMKRNNTWFLFQDGAGMQEKLSGLGISLQGPQSASGASGPEISFYKSPDVHGEAFGIASLLKRIHGSNRDLNEKTAIVLPSAEALFPLLHHTLNVAEAHHYNISLGYPLLRTPVFGFFNNLMTVITSMSEGQVYVPHYLDFVLHPYTKNILFEGRADITRIMFHAVEEALTDNRSRKFMSFSAIGSDQAFSRLITETVLKAEPGITLGQITDHLGEIHRNTIEKLLSPGNVGDFAVRAREVLEYVYERSTARQHPLFHPYAEAFARQLDGIARSLMKEMQFAEPAGYFTLLRRYIKTCYVPFEGSPLKGMQVLGFLETRNLTFDTVFVLDVNEGVLPDTAREDSLLPFKARQMLGLPTYLDREDLIAYHFDTLVNGAREVHLFYVENDRMQRSRLIERLLWERQKQEAKKDDREFIRTVQYAVTLKCGAPFAVEKTGPVASLLKEFTFSASSLDTYLRCPLKFYHRYVLNLTEKEIISDELEREEIGSFVHHVLHAYFRTRKGRLLRGQDIEVKEMRSLLYAAFDGWYGEAPTGEAYLLRRQIERHLADFLEKYQLPMIEAHEIEIVGLERDFQVTRDDFKLRARLDRIEKRDGKLFIIDYKTTSNRNRLKIDYKKLDLEKRETWSEAIGTLQLPFYLLTFSAATGERQEDISPLFLLLGQTVIDRTIELPLFEDPSGSKERYEGLRRLIFRLMEEMADPRVPFLPARNQGDACGGCAYGCLCTNG